MINSNHPISDVLEGSPGFCKPCSDGCLHAALKAKMELAQGKKKKKDDKKEDKKKKKGDAATAVAAGQEVLAAAEGHLKAVVQDDTGKQSTTVTADSACCPVTPLHFFG